jgi:multimeric flavodoxin WrbA
MVYGKADELYNGFMVLPVLGRHDRFCRMKEGTSRMDIGIVVYSKTGNTLSVAKRVEEALRAAGHKVALERVEAENDQEKAAGNIRFSSLPDLSRYEALVFASPVQAFSLNPVMKAYLAKAGQLAGKKAACFLTMGFPAVWMGGRQAMGLLRNAMAEKKTVFCGEGIVCWSNKKRESMIDAIVKQLASAF